MPDEKDKPGYGTFWVDYQKEQQESLNKNYSINHNEIWKADPPKTWQERIERERENKESAAKKGNNSGIIGNTKGGLSIFPALIFFFIAVTFLWFSSLNAVDNVFPGKDWEFVRSFSKHLIDLSTKIFMPVGAIIIVVSLFFRALWKGTISLIFAGLTIFFGSAVYLFLNSVKFLGN